MVVLRNHTFPYTWKKNLMAQGEGPFKVLEWIRDNGYMLKL